MKEKAKTSRLSVYDQTGPEQQTDEQKLVMVCDRFLFSAILPPSLFQTGKIDLTVADIDLNDKRKSIVLFVIFCTMCSSTYRFTNFKN